MNIWQIKDSNTGEWFNVSKDTYNYCDNDIERCREIFGEVKELNNITMEQYSDEIIKAYKNWMDKIGEEVDEQWQDGYKKKIAASKRAGDKFEKLCKASGLNYVTVAASLAPHNFNITR